jgi:hypothetical protein
MINNNQLSVKIKKYHMKNIYLLIFLFSVIKQTTAQDLVNKIPANATTVITIKSEQLTQLLSADEISKTVSGKKLLSFISEKSGKEIKAISEAGIQLSAKSYYFYLGTDSIGYHCLLVPIQDADKMESILAAENKIERNKNIRTIYTKDSSAIAMWNEKQLLLVSGNQKWAFFNTKEVMDRYGLSATSYGLYPNISENVDSVKSYMDEPSDHVVPSEPDTVIAMDEGSVDAAPMEADTSVVEYNNNIYEKDALIKKNLGIAWMIAITNELFTSFPKTSIATNRSYLNSVDEKAAASVWISSIGDLYSNIMPFYNSPLYKGNVMDIYKSLTARLYMEEKQLRIVTNIEMLAEQAESYSKIYGRKLNKKMFQYINSDSAIGYVAFSIDTKAYLEELPKIMESTYKGYGLNSANEEIGLAAEFIALLLDEEAVSRVVKGDGMLVFNGVYQQEVTYTDYAYDENFNKTEVEKIKMETLPKFLLMFSSEDEKFLSKVINYGIKKKAVEADGVFYKIKIPNNPVGFYFVQKNGVFFLTNAKEDITAICTDNFKANISKEQKKTLRNHNFYTYISPKKIASQISLNNIEVVEEFTKTINALEKCGDVYMWANPIKNNVMSAEMIMEVPAGNQNSLKYLFSIIDKIIQ